MLVGIGFIGMLTGTIATYFIKDKTKASCKADVSKVIDLSDLDDSKFEEVINFINYISNK